jgi:hypothetical protein
MTETIILKMPTAQLVFGLRWYVLLGGNGLHMASRYARQFRASHTVVLGQPPALVGVASIPGARQVTTLHSAAANVARIYASGTHALILPVAQHGWWLVAVHEGLPIARTDRFYATREEAGLAIDELRHAYPVLVLLGASGQPDAPTLAQIESASTAVGRLVKAPRFVQHRGWLRATVAGAAIAIGAYGYQHFMYAAAPEKAEQSGAIDNALVWRQQVQNSLKGLVVHGVPGLNQLFASIAQTPVQQGGWVLSQLVCHAAYAQWHCQAHYRRTARAADSRALLTNPPQGGRVHFPSIDAAQVSWAPAVHSMALSVVRLPSAQYSEKLWLSAMQRLKMAFSSLDVEPPVALKISAPLGSNGLPLGRPANVALYSSRQVYAKGPLRSMTLLFPHSRFMFWRSFKVSVSPNPSPAARTSALMAELQGVLYEKNP